MTLLVIAKTGVVKIIDVKTGAVKISITAPVAGRSNKN
jgi:sRNA-binding carbon storage regulator CsrA